MALQYSMLTKMNGLQAQLRYNLFTRVVHDRHINAVSATMLLSHI